MIKVLVWADAAIGVSDMIIPVKVSSFRIRELPEAGTSVGTRAAG